MIELLVRGDDGDLCAVGPSRCREEEHIAKQSSRSSQPCKGLPVSLENNFPHACGNTDLILDAYSEQTPQSLNRSFRSYIYISFICSCSYRSGVGRDGYENL